MRARSLLLAAVLATSAVLAACGSDDDDEVAASGDGSTAIEGSEVDGSEVGGPVEGNGPVVGTDGGAAGGAQGATAATLELDVPDELVAGAPVTWQLTLTNPTDEDVTLGFPTAQHGDVALSDGGGTEVYRWSDGMVFAQVLTDVVVPAGGETTVELAGGTLDVEPGDHRLEATIPATPGPGPVTTDVTVTG